MKSSPFRFAFAAMLFAVSPASAVLLVHEPFSGYTVGSITGQMPNANTTGLNTATAYGNVGQTDFLASDTGLTFSNLVTSGGAIVSTAGATQATSATLATSQAVDGTLYSSYLVRFSASRTTGGTDGVESRRTSNGGTIGYRAFADSRRSSTLPSASYDGSDLASNPTNATTGSNTPASNQTYIVISTITNVGQAVTAAGTFTMTTYVLSESQFNVMMGQSDPYAYLSDAARTLGTSNEITARAVDTNNTASITAANNGFKTGDSIQLVNVNQAVTLDELRYATTFLEVVPIPEASTASLAMAALGFLGLRRRR